MNGMNQGATANADMADEDWFRANPHRALRLRRLTAAELQPPPGVTCLHTPTHTLVRHVQLGIWETRILPLHMSSTRLDAVMASGSDVLFAAMWASLDEQRGAC